MLFSFVVILPAALHSPSLAASLISPLESRFANTPTPADGQIDGIIAISVSRDRMETAARLALRYAKVEVILSITGEERALEVMRANGIGPERLIGE